MDYETFEHVAADSCGFKDRSINVARVRHRPECSSVPADGGE